MLKLSNHSKKYLIINADDYGYYRCVSQGILAAARKGVVTATSIMANRPGIETYLNWIVGAESLDVGVHLNATYGEPMTLPMRDRMRNNNHMFNGKFWLLCNTLIDRTLVKDIADEWRAQIAKCVNSGARIDFLNSHEHVHMFPNLFGVIRELADEFGIRHVRYSLPDWYYCKTLSGTVRNGLMQLLCTINGPVSLAPPQPRMFGLAVSGRLNQDYLDALVKRMEAGEVGELMCHPGHFDRSEITDPILRSYHDWEGENSTLLGAEFKRLREEENLELIGYRQLPY